MTQILLNGLMQQYKIIIAYDGTDYAGWQIQPDHMTVAKKIQDTFSEVFNRPLILYGISRTDAGVHAQGQVATFKTDLIIDSQRMLQAWNARLPFDIVIRSIEPVTSCYNPHAHVLYKTYWYRVFTQRPLPHLHRYGWFVHYSIDFTKLEKCLQIFVGTHDFRSFCTGDEREDTVRTITHIAVSWESDFQAYRIAISGPKFLRYMIRRIVGACIYVAGKKHLSIDVLHRALEEKNAEQVLPKAPAMGLILYEVVYHR